MADHKIYGNNGAGNVQALDYDRRQVAHLQAVVDRLNAVIDKHNTDCEDLRAQLAAANARADAAWDALRNIAELNKTARDENGHAWDNSDLIAQEIHFALRDKPAPAVLPLLPDMVDAATAAGVVVWWDNEAQEIKMAVTVQEAARVLADYIDSDMMKVNRMIDAMKRVSMETPARHWLSQVVRAIAGGD